MTNYSIDVHFKYKNDPTEKPQIGVIAQEVQEVFPELVGSSGEEGYLNVQYSLLAPVAIQGLKELKDLVDQQQTTIEQQGELIARLSARLDAMVDK